MDFDYKLILWCVYAGILIAAVYTCYQKTVVGRLVRALLDKGCDSPENALTLADLGLEKHSRIRAALKPKSTLSHLVSAVFEQNDTQSPKNAFDFSATRFYLAEEKKEKALHYNQEGSSLFTLLLAAIGGLIIVLLGYILVPYLSSLFTEMLS